MLARTALIAAGIVLTFGLNGNAEELKSGPQPDQTVKFFLVEKIAGAEDDGQAVGKKLCYRCKNFKNRQVIIFSRQDDDAVAKLVSGLNNLLEKQEGDVRGFVNIIGEDREEAVDTAKRLAGENKLSKVPVVVPNEFSNGPGDYGLNEKANVTVIIAKERGKVVASHAFEKLDGKAAEAVVSDINKKLISE